MGKATDSEIDEKYNHVIDEANNYNLAKLEYYKSNTFN